MPNWFIHAKWAAMAGISEATAHVVNRIIDYGSFSTIFNVEDAPEQFKDDSRYFVIKYLHNKDPVNQTYAKAYYLHLLLDHLKETRIDDLEKAIDDFVINKALVELPIGSGINLNFKRELDDLTSMILSNRDEIWSDLHGSRRLDG